MPVGPSRPHADPQAEDAALVQAQQHRRLGGAHLLGLDAQKHPGSSFDFDASGNGIITMANEASDPRMSGTWTEVWGCRQCAGFETCVASVRVEHEGGTWLGRADGFGHQSGIYDMTVFEGHGDYAGLTALRVVSAGPTGEVEEGVILDFDQPEQPGLPSE